MKMFIIVKHTKNTVAKMVFSMLPKQHPNLASALDEAGRLAAGYPDDVFYIFQAVRKVTVTPPPPPPVTVENLAPNCL